MENRRFILMLEDDPDDRFLTKSTLEALSFDVPIVFVKSSTELFTFLEGAARPFLILMEYHSTPENGVQILQRLKSDERYCSIPVVVLGDSKTERHVAACYQHGASSYIIKPDTTEATKEKINSFFNYWLKTVAV